MLGRVCGRVGAHGGRARGILGAPKVAWASLGPFGSCEHPWRVRGLPGSACRCVEAGFTLNPNPVGGAPGERCGLGEPGGDFRYPAGPLAAMRTPHRGTVDPGSACQYVETGLTPNPREHAAASELSGGLATTRPHGEAEGAFKV